MLESVRLRFHGDLAALLPKKYAAAEFGIPLVKTRSVKDLIESLAIPHTEVDVIRVNGESVSFSFLIRGGEFIQVYPVKYAPENHNLIRNQPALTSEPGFLLDVHLGRLAGYLRLLGYDTLYDNDSDDPELARLCADEHRILVSCDRRLLMRNQVVWGYLMRSRHPPEQIGELLSRFDLLQYDTGRVRCMQCNGLIRAVEKSTVESQLLPLTRQHYAEFYQCESCSKIYWKGSHYANLRNLLHKSRALQK